MIASYILIFFVVSSVTQGLNYDGLRVKYGESDEKIDQEYFFSIPRKQAGAGAAGWDLVPREPRAALPRLNLYCPKDRVVCALYDKAGAIAGLQIALPIEGLETPVNAEELFQRWDVPAAGSQPAKSYWVATQYFVENDSADRTSTQTLQDGVWLSDRGGQLARISLKEAGFKTPPFVKQNCIPNMGDHYYYNFTRGNDCSRPSPWFLLATGGELVGSGFLLPGRLAQPTRWFDNLQSSKTSFRYVAPDVPDCLVDQVGKHGSLSMHIYYIDEPWTIKCN